MSNSLYPLLYQVNTRVWLTELSIRIKRRATLDDIPDSDLDKFVADGFDWIWLLSVWQTGSEGQRISRQNAGWRRDFEETLPDLEEEDIEGSGFAITRYSVSDRLGGDAALSRLRRRLSDRGLKLMLDFVPNHTAPDHDWVKDHPDYYISSNEYNLEREPANFTRVSSGPDDLILAHGRDLYFSGWPDTLQLNYGNPALHEAMTGELIRIAGQCDGVRCDMAMLVLPEVFHRTWGIRCMPFWSGAIQRVHAIHPSFCFLAEVYWDMEWTLIQQGFDYAYDKRLYDRLKEGHAVPVREHFYADSDYQGRMARFLENHDEARVAADFPEGKHEAAAIITFFSPGLRFFHQGQPEGRIKRISPHLVRRPHEPLNEKLQSFYCKILEILRMPVFRSGKWQLLDSMQAWDNNLSHVSYVSFAWQGTSNEKMLVTVNYSPDRSQGYIRFPFNDTESGIWLLTDLISGRSYERDGAGLQTRGLYLDEPAWSIYVFSILRKQ